MEENEYAKPNDINIEKHFWGSDFNKSELEDIARAIVIYLQNKGNNKWEPFTLNELWGNDNPHDTWFFDRANFSFVAQQYITKKDNYYSVTPLFIKSVSKYKKKESN